MLIVRQIRYTRPSVPFLYRVIGLSRILIQISGYLGPRCTGCLLMMSDLCQVCTTLGMLTPEQAKQLREAGLTAYNHNLDTSPEYYSKITSSRKYEASSPAWYLKEIDTAAAHIIFHCGCSPQEYLGKLARCKEYEACPVLQSQCKQKCCTWGSLCLDATHKSASLSSS